MNLDQDGFTVIEQVVSPQRCLEITERLDDSSASSIGSRTLLAASWCRELGETIRGSIAQVVVGIGDCELVQCTYFEKSADKNWLVAWHQDRMVPVSARAPSPGWNCWTQKEDMPFVQPPDEVLSCLIAVRLHLDDSTLDNGPLRVIPRTHCLGTLSSEQIDQHQRDTSPIACIVPQGGVLVLRPLLLHASSKSKSEQQRRVLHFLFGPQRLAEGIRWPTW